eukprot:CAMPEP_0119039862 /NCGR_PEP_ID=MMETSP1177-20130426/9590_1 /TAXON_ID=2985 /ORGANISM="Ochromonas sp, Strain CCMP1899" /LENGTH=532 /DNA_ID=CAMNT_0007004293 /DNA_START=1168 /DNA_END=2766 /DNA_ORIENTATION=+
MVDKFSEKEISLNFSEGDILPLQSLRDLLANDSISHPTGDLMANDSVSSASVSLDPSIGAPSIYNDSNDNSSSKSHLIIGNGEFDILKDGVPIGILNLNAQFSGTFMSTNFSDDTSIGVTGEVYIRARSRKANFCITPQSSPIDNMEETEPKVALFTKWGGGNDMSLSPQMLYEIMTAVNENSDASITRSVFHTRPSSLTSHVVPSGGFYVKKGDLMSTLLAAGLTSDELKVIENLCYFDSTENDGASSNKFRDNDLIDLKYFCSEIGNDSPSNPTSPPSPPRPSLDNRRSSRINNNNNNINNTNVNNTNNNNNNNSSSSMSVSPSIPRPSLHNPPLNSPVKSSPSLYSMVRTVLTPYMQTLQVNSTFSYFSSTYSNGFSLASILCRGLPRMILKAIYGVDSNACSFVTLSEPPTLNPYPHNPFVKNNDSDEDGDNEYDNDGYKSSSSISSLSSLSSSTNSQIQKEKTLRIADKFIKNRLSYKYQIKREHNIYVMKNMIRKDYNTPDSYYPQMTNYIGGLLYMCKSGLKIFL